MPPKEVQLIKPITSKDDFEGVLASEKRLVVLDVYLYFIRNLHIRRSLFFIFGSNYSEKLHHDAIQVPFLVWSLHADGADLQVTCTKHRLLGATGTVLHGTMNVFF